MKKTTKRILGIAAASAIVISVTTGVFAHGGYGSGFGPGWGGHHGMMGGPGGMHRGSGGPGWMMGDQSRGPGRMMGGQNGGLGRLMGDDPVAYTDQQLSDLKSVLQINADQEATWKAYEEALKGKAAVMLSHRQIMLESGAPAPEQRFAFHQQGLQQMQQVNAASEKLYQALTPEQQAKSGNLIGFGNCRR